MAHDSTSPQPPSSPSSEDTETRRLNRPSDTDTAPLPRIKIADRYEVARKLGSGGFGDVYLAEDTQLLRRVAIKQIRSDRLDATSRDRFLREARALAALDHRNIVPIHDAQLEREPIFLVMKWIEGRTLRDLIRINRSWEEDWLLRVVRELAGGLQHLHQHGVLHRDLKPGNVLIDSDERPVIVDFGLASLDSSSSLTQTDVVVGTWHYMAPEALDGKESPRSDLYSLGATIYHLAFGELTHEAEHAASLLGKKQRETPRRLFEPDDRYSENFLLLLRRLLQPDPERRISSARQLLDQLDDLWPPEGAQQRTSSLAFDVIGEEMEEIESLAKKTLERIDSAGSKIDPVLPLLDRFGRRSERLLDRFERSTDDDLRDPLVSALLKSIQTICQSIDLRLRDQLAGRKEIADGPVRFLRNHLLDRAAALLERVRRPEEASPSSDFFAFDLKPEIEGEEEESWQEMLTRGGELDRHAAILSILGTQKERFLREYPNLGETQRSELTDRLWQEADTLLLEGRRQAKEIFDCVIAHCPECGAGQSWILLYSLFRNALSKPRDPESLQLLLSSLDEADRRVMGRSLLIHPHKELRQLAYELIRPEDAWPVVTHRLTPFRSLLEIWRRMCNLVGDDFKKIFFVTSRHRLINEPLEADIEAAVFLTEEFFSVDTFHEREMFQLLVSLDEHLRAESRRLHFALDFYDRYVERMRHFLSQPKREDQPVVQWGTVPLPVQRLIARRGLFPTYFCCHPVDPIALEVLRHLLRHEDLTTYLKLYRINRALLAEAAKESRFFQSENSRFLLVANPKTPPFIVAKYIDYLNQTSLKKLAASHECNPFSRHHAERILNKRETMRSRSRPGRR